MEVTRVSMPRSSTDSYEQNICSLCTLNYTCSRASYTSHVSSSMQQDVDRGDRMGNRLRDARACGDEMLCLLFRKYMFLNTLIFPSV